MEKQALRQFLRKQSRAQIPVTLYAIITEHRQIREKDKRRVGASLTEMYLLLQMKEIIIESYQWFYQLTWRIIIYKDIYIYQKVN
jgi:hypothetical protein